VEHVERKALAVERTAEQHEIVAELIDDVVDDAVVGGRGGAQHRHAARQEIENPHDASVVGSEVVSPVADAVCFVDDEQTGAGRELRQHGVAKARVGEAFGRDEQEVDSVVVELCVVVSCVVLEVIGVSVVVVCVSVTTGAAGAGVSTIGAAGTSATVVCVVVSVVITAGDCVTVTFDALLSGMILTFVLRPVADELPAEPTELLVYARPLLSTLAGPEMMAGVVAPSTFCALVGAGAVPTT